MRLTVETDDLFAVAELPPSGPRPPRTPEQVQAALKWIAEANALRAEQEAKYGLLPDSTLDIAADRRRDD